MPAAARVDHGMTTGLVVLAAAVVLALGFGLWRAATDGRFRGTHAVRGSTADPAPSAEPVEAHAAASVLAGTPYDGQLGERATLLQFSSAFCAPCRATRRVLEDVARIVPGVAHVEVDAEHHLDLVRRLGILRTPTTLVLDPHGREVSRAAGAPSKQAVIASLELAGVEPPAQARSSLVICSMSASTISWASRSALVSAFQPSSSRALDGVADQRVDLGGPLVLLVVGDVLLPVEPGVRERRLHRTRARCGPAPVAST